jgi:hypothetical protein
MRTFASFRWPVFGHINYSRLLSPGSGLFSYSRCHARHVSESPPKPGSPSAREAKAPAQTAPPYDQRRARARLALIEQQVTLAEALTDLEQAAARPALPPGVPDPWEQSRNQAERAAAEAQHWISQLAPLVAAPETVADEDGRLPRDRREAFLGEFAARVNAEVAGLNEKLPALRAGLKATRDKQQRPKARDELRQGTARLAYLQALPPFTAADMCAECPWPMAWHSTGVTFCLETGAILSEPCRSWPVWNAKITAGLARLAETMRHQQKQPAPKPAPQLLAVIAAGSSVEDVITRLTQVQADNPGAEVRRGKRNSWEIWSTPADSQPTSKN